MNDRPKHAELAARLMADATPKPAPRGVEQRAASVLAMQRAMRLDASRRRVGLVIGAIAAAACLALCSWQGATWLTRARVRNAATTIDDDVRVQQKTLASVWDDERRLAVRRAFFATGEPYAATTWSAVERAFDDYVKAWTSMLTSTRPTQHLEGESRELRDLRVECLTDRLMQLGTLSNLYVGADSKMLERAALAARSLPNVAMCAEPAALRVARKPPSLRQSREEVERLRAELAQAAAFE